MDNLKPPGANWSQRFSKTEKSQMRELGIFIPEELSKAETPQAPEAKPISLPAPRPAKIWHGRPTGCDNHCSMVTSLPPELANCAPLKALIQTFEQAIEHSEKLIAEKSKIAESSNWFLSSQKKWEIECARKDVECERRAQLQRRQALKAVSAPFSYRADHPWT